ncbi:hypothetical protein BOX15_Mlig027746g1 [Macrostomum lignano]|uniref:Uncharacterized protein n=1 Tax=Macrostomum lignano TaxID=282301 RepID=A0A267E953_9PLAT|nr:hypothetical protein BOX15_Mlig027746g1 [Macrostomum lignano]
MKSLCLLFLLGAAAACLIGVSQQQQLSDGPTATRTVLPLEVEDEETAKVLANPRLMRRIVANATEAHLHHHQMSRAKRGLYRVCVFRCRSTAMQCYEACGLNADGCCCAVCFFLRTTD